MNNTKIYFYYSDEYVKEMGYELLANFKNEKNEIKTLSFGYICNKEDKVKDIIKLMNDSNEFKNTVISGFFSTNCSYLYEENTIGHDNLDNHHFPKTITDLEYF